jgi:hypothetical protein
MRRTAHRGTIPPRRKHAQVIPDPAVTRANKEKPHAEPQRTTKRRREQPDPGPESLCASLVSSAALRETLPGSAQQTPGSGIMVTGCLHLLPRTRQPRHPAPSSPPAGRYRRQVSTRPRIQHRPHDVRRRSEEGKPVGGGEDGGDVDGGEGTGPGARRRGRTARGPRRRYAGRRPGAGSSVMGNAVRFSSPTRRADLSGWCSRRGRRRASPRVRGG